MSDLIAVAAFHDPEEAVVAYSFLRANGVEAELADTATLAALPTHRVALGGQRVMVPAASLAIARRLLAEVREDSVPAGYEVDDMRCPKCGGDRFTRVKPWLLPAVLLWLTGAPWRWNAPRLRCTVCGTIRDAEEAETSA